MTEWKLGVKSWYNCRVKLLQKYKIEIVFGLMIVALYFLLRLPNLTLQPIFADEAIYIRWAQVMRSEPTLRFLPLSDGKTPLFMWAMMPLFKVFHDPLFAGRILSVFSGFMTLLGIFAISMKLFNSRVALWSGLIYSILPYTVFFDRMALVDSMLAAFTVWSVYFAIWLVQKPRLDLSMILGYLLGGALLVKTPAMFNILVLPVSILAVSIKHARKSLGKIFIFWIVAIAIAGIIYNLLRLGPGFQQLSARNADYIFSPIDLIKRPLDPFIPHLKDLSDWFPKLFTWPILIFGVIGGMRVIWEKNRLGWVILLWAIIPLLIETALLKTFTARYLLFPIPLLIVLTGYGIEEITNKIFSWVLLVFLMILPLHFDYLLLTDPASAPLPKEERRGYLEDWTAGYGFPEIASFLIDQKKNGPVVVGTEGNFGTLPDGLLIYLDKENIAVLGGKATISAELKEAAKKHQTFFVGNSSRVGSVVEGAQFIKAYPKALPLDGGPVDQIVLYKVLSR